MPVATVTALGEGALIDGVWFDAVRDSLTNLWQPAQRVFTVTGAGQTTTSTSLVDVPTVTTTITPVADPANGSRLYVHFTLVLNADADRQARVAINYNGSDVAEYYISLRTSVINYNFACSIPAGTVDVSKTLKLRWRLESAGTLTLTNGHGNRIIAVEY